MVVEDESIIALDLQIMLKSCGFEVCGPVASGEESIQLANLFRPDLVLMDVKLRGEMRGIEAAHIIHDHFKIPVVYLTACGDEATVQEALECADYGYLRKPFAENEVEELIRRIL